MNYKLLKLLAGFAFLCSTLGLQAQTIFDVELVFFKRIGDLHITGQQEPLLLEAEEAQYLLSDSNSVLPEGFTLLQRNQQKLEGVYRRLRSSPTMRPLLHIGWRQQLMDKDDTPWLSYQIQDGPMQTGLQDFQGIIRLSRNQGLVLENQIIGYKEPAEGFALDNQTDAELEISETDSPENNSADLDLPFETASEAEQVEAQTQNQAQNQNQEQMQATVDDNLQIPDELSGFFEMSETIKVKLGKLYYIDHPTMGLLVKVTPYQASLEEQDGLN